MELPGEIQQIIIGLTDQSCYPELVTVCKNWRNIIQKDDQDDIIYNLKLKRLHNIMKRESRVDIHLSIALICDNLTLINRCNFSQITINNDAILALLFKYALKNHSTSIINDLMNRNCDSPIPALYYGYEDLFYERVLLCDRLVFNYDIFAVKGIDHTKVYRFLSEHNLVSSSTLILELAQYGNLDLYYEISLRYYDSYLQFNGNRSNCSKLFKIDPIIASHMLDNFKCDDLIKTALQYCSGVELLEVPRNNFIASQALLHNDKELLAKWKPNFAPADINFAIIPLLYFENCDKILEHLLVNFPLRDVTVEDSWEDFISKLSYSDQWEYLDTLINVGKNNKHLLTEIALTLMKSGVYTIEKYELAKKALLCM